MASLAPQEGPSRVYSESARVLLLRLGWLWSAAEAPLNNGATAGFGFVLLSPHSMLFQKRSVSTLLRGWFGNAVFSVSGGSYRHPLRLVHRGYAELGQANAAVASWCRRQTALRAQGLLSAADHRGCLGTIAGSAWFLLIMREIKAQFKQSCKP